jgi:hypothetical protein
MKPDRWQKVEQLYQAALEREESPWAFISFNPAHPTPAGWHRPQARPDKSINPPLRFPEGNSTSSSAL